MNRIRVATWVLVGIQMAHSVEEYLTGFDRRFPVFLWYNSQFSSVGQGMFFAFNLSIVVMMALLSLVAFSDWWRERFPVLLAIKAKSSLDWKMLAEIKETFQESKLPFRVDVLD